MVQGTRDAEAMVTTFTLQFGMSKANLLWYEDYPGVHKVCGPTEGPSLITKTVISHLNNTLSFLKYF